MICMYLPVRLDKKTIVYYSFFEYICVYMFISRIGPVCKKRLTLTCDFFRNGNNSTARRPK